MAHDRRSATTVIDAPAEAIFAVLADPAKHAAVDGTGWVREPLDPEPLSVRRADLPDVHVPPGPPPTAPTRWRTGFRCSTPRTPSLENPAMRPGTVA